MNVLDTILFLKPTWQGVVWENDINQIVPNELEDFIPTAEDLLAVDETVVTDWKQQQDSQKNAQTIDSLTAQVNQILQELQDLRANNTNGDPDN